MLEIRRFLAGACLVVVLVSPGLASPGFLPNVGQLPEPASHVLRDGRTTVICEPGRLVISTGDDTRTLRFDGAAVPSRIEARLPLPTRYTFLLGNDPARWRRNVHASAELVYHDLWPGLALVVTATSEALRWEVVAAPGADLAAGRVVWEGMTAATGRVNWARTPPRTAAVNNPSALAWSTFFGGENSEKALVVRAAPDGTLVLAGRTDSLTFPTTPGGYDQVPAGDNDAFVAKMSANGDTLLWCTLIGGTAYDVAGGVAIAADGSVVVTGNTSSVDFPTTPDAYQAVHGGLRDAWAARLSADGADLQWGTFLGGSSVDEGVTLVLDADDSPILLGNTASPDFPTTSGAYDRMFNGDWDAFILRLDPAGHALTWSTFLGGDRFDAAHGLTLDGSGKPVIVGQTGSPGFPTTAGAFDETANGGDDAFACALAPDGSDLAWSTLLGGAAADAAMGVVVDEFGRVLATGSTASTDFPTTAGAFNTVHRGATDLFVACVAPDGTSVVWSGLGGGSDQDVARSLALDPWGGVVAIGYTRSPDFPIVAGAFDDTFNGVLDLFVMRLTGDGSILSGSTFLGGAGREDGYAVIVRPDGRAVVSGLTESADYPATPGAFDEALDGSADAVLFAMDLGTITVTVSDTPAAPAMIAAIRPNPCNPSTTIAFTLPVGGATQLTIHDLRGRRVATLADGILPAGAQTRRWDGRDGEGREVSAGVYLCRLASPSGIATRPVTIVR